MSRLETSFSNRDAGQLLEVLNMQQLFLRSRMVFGVCLLGTLMINAAGAQSSAVVQPPDVGAPGQPVDSATAAGGKTASAVSKSVVSKRADLVARSAATTAAAHRPKMGLKLTMTQPKGHSNAKGALRPSDYQNTRGSEKAQQYYAGVWGVDKLRASSTNSGNLIKFSYRVLQPQRAAPLGDHEAAPELIGIRSNAVLHIPTMEKIGQLRQMSAAQADKEYWMVFSNKGNLIRRGDEVSVVIGHFHADGLIVE